MAQTVAPQIPVTQAMLDVADKIARIFIPESRRQFDKVYPDKTKPARFVHYTSAEAALEIIKTKRLRMRKTTCMVDYSEVQHGHDLLQQIFTRNQQLRQRFIASLDACYAGLGNRAINEFDVKWADILLDTYVTSLSEHDAEDDLYGRLSMWRAFRSDQQRVALVVNIPAGSGAGLALGVVFAPASYAEIDDAEREVGEITQNIGENVSFLKTIPEAELSDAIVGFLKVLVVTRKHPAFKEEREWRVLYTPSQVSSPLMEPSTDVVFGVPQPVQRLPLDAVKSLLIGSLDLAAIFDRLIIGPTQYAAALTEAFAAALTSGGVTDAWNRIHLSKVPLRT